MRSHKNDESDRDRLSSFIAGVREVASSSALLFWRVWWKSFVAFAALLILLFCLDLPGDKINLLVGIGFCLSVSGIGAAILGLFAVAWKYLGIKAFIPPIGALVGSLLSSLLGVLLIYATFSLVVGDELKGPQAHGGGHAVALLAFMLIKLFAIAGAALGGLGGIALVSFLVIRKRRPNQPSDS